MALIKLGAFVTEISGKIGGTIFSRSKGGAYAKNRVIPSNPQTLAQNGVRQIFGNIAQLWRTLSDSQRASWDNSTDDFPYQNRLGESKVLSGSALHQKTNLNLNSVGLAPINIPASPQAVAGTKNLVLVMEAGGDQTIQATQSETNANMRYSVEATESISAGVKNVSNRYKKIGTMLVADLGTPFDISSLYTAVFGEPTAGSKVSVRLKPVNTVTGQAGVPTEITTLVV